MGRGKTIVEKIISSHCGQDVRAGDIAVVNVDLAMAHDSGFLAIQAFREYGNLTFGMLPVWCLCLITPFLP